jgi:membrane protease YdiL (CAAX protease family)
MLLSVSQTTATHPLITASAFALVAFLVHRGLYLYGFFELPFLQKDARVWSFSQTLACLGIYFINSFLTIPLIFNILLTLDFHLNLDLLKNSKTQTLVLQSIYVFLNVFLIGVYLAFQDKKQLAALWKDPQIKKTNSYIYDVLIGFSTWFVAFPVIVCINTLSEYVNSLIFSQPEVDQVAVKFLKLNSSSMIPLLVVLFMIILSAPIIEEFLFRGCIQNWLRSKLGIKTSIIVTSIFFSAMHFSISQSFSNIPLLLSLFIFSIYLGFVYEKTRSLVSSITLHMTFNTISVVRILFFN